MITRKEDKMCGLYVKTRWVNIQSAGVAKYPSNEQDERSECGKETYLTYKVQHKVVERGVI